MNKRFDTLFNLISKNNTVLERQLQQTNGNINETYFNDIKENITMETENRKRIHYQIYRAQELKNCYKNLISQEQPHAPAKFRTKVNENTPPYELPIHRQATTDNINREITLLRERRINWTKEIENIDTKLKDLIDSLDLTRETRNEIKLQNQNKIKNDEERNVREWNKHLDYLMNIHNKEQNDDSVDNLLKIVGQKLEQNETTVFSPISGHR